MSDAEKSQLADYAARWKRASPLLEAQREIDVRNSDTAAVIASFDGLWEDAVKSWPPSDTSGLVEQQRVFNKLRKA